MIAKETLTALKAEVTQPAAIFDQKFHRTSLIDLVTSIAEQIEASDIEQRFLDHGHHLIKTRSPVSQLHLSNIPINLRPTFKFIAPGFTQLLTLHYNKAVSYGPLMRPTPVSTLMLNREGDHVDVSVVSRAEINHFTVIDKGAWVGVPALVDMMRPIERAADEALMKITRPGAGNIVDLDKHRAPSMR